MPSRRRNNSRTLVCAVLLVFTRTPAHAEILTYSSGTGFVVDRNGTVLTNSHVVERCRQFTLAGAVNAGDAELLARDTELDLALLRTRTPVMDAASFASRKQPLRVGDPVVIFGYPGQAWQTGQPVVGEARIVDTKGPRGEEKWLEFSDSLAQGNSGGPLLDSAGNVVGVVSAKARAYSMNQAAAREELIRKFDIAVSLPEVRRFLQANHVPFREADSGIYLASSRVGDMARRFTVNIRCRIETSR